MKKAILTNMFCCFLIAVFGQHKEGFEEWELSDPLAAYAPFEQITFHSDSVYSLWTSGDSLVYSIYRKSRTTLVLFYLEDEGVSLCAKKKKNKFYLKYNYTGENSVTICCSRSRKQHYFYTVSYNN